MRPESRRYEVPGWGRGELWTAGRLVLAHEFEFEFDTYATAAETPVSDTGVVDAPASPVNVPSSVVESIAENPLILGECGCGAIGTDPRRVAPNKDRCLTPGSLVERFLAFFAGDDPRLDGVRLDLSWGTPFQRAVTTALRAVPRGETVSYGELAALAGYPGAARAVGTYCAQNRFALLVPCHRVVSANGLGGYGTAGVVVKRRLLALEGVRV